MQEAMMRVVRSGWYVLGPEVKGFEDELAAYCGTAHHDLEQVIIAMSGSFDLILDDGTERKRVHLNRSHRGVYVRDMVWREMDNFSSGSVCMVLASNKYDEADYIRDYDEFVSTLLKVY